MGNKNSKFIPAVIFFLVIFMFWFTASSSTKASGFVIDETVTDYMNIEVLDNDGKIKMGTGDIIATTRLGYNGESKCGRNMRADVVVESRKRDYTGKLRLEYVIPFSDNRVMVQKSITIEKGGESKIQLALPPMPYIEDLTIKITLCDENNEELCYKYCSIYCRLDDISQVYVGMLSDNQESLRYIRKLVMPNCGLADGDMGMVFWLGPDDITDDARMLSSLDVILIDNFDTGKFSKDQTEAIMEWVNQGGTLLLGGGVTASKVFKAFSESLAGVRIGNISSINTNFGISRKELAKLAGKNLPNKKIPLDVAQIDIKGSEMVLADNDGNKLISKVPYGEGNVLVTGFPLGLEEDTANLYGTLIVDVIIKNLSRQRKLDMGITGKSMNNTYSAYNNSSASYEGNTMLLNETGALPNIKLYAVIMLLYVFIAGPLSYMVTKKKDKRTMLWIIVPAFSVMFSTIIYLIGTSTRIQQPYINFTSVIELPEKGGKENNVNTTFSLTSPFSGPYEVQLQGNTDIFPAIIDAGGYYLPGKRDEYNKLKCGTECGEDASKIIVNDVPAFESTYFSMNNKSTSKGTARIEITEEENIISGTISNEMSCGLEDCMLYRKGVLYYISSLPAGKTVSLTGADIYEITSYDDDFEKLIEDVMCGSMHNNSTNNALKRKIGMILTFAGNNKTNSTWFYGFVKDGGETGFADHFIYKSYGETGVYKYI